MLAAVDEAILLGHFDPKQLKVFVTVPRLGVDQPKIDLFDNVSRSEPACDNPPDMHSMGKSINYVQYNIV